MRGSLSWKEVWSTGISEIDCHHRQLATQLNRILEMLDQGTEASNYNEQLTQQLSEILWRLRRHFAYEESLMKSVDYPEFAAHRREHMFLLADLSRFIRELERRKWIYNHEMQQELKHWFVAHLATDDMSFAKYYRAFVGASGRSQLFSSASQRE